MEREYLYNKNLITVHSQIENQKIGKFFIYICKHCKKEKEKRINSSNMNDFNFVCCSCNRKITNIKRFGVENPFQNEEIKNKIRKTTFEKYGVENVNKLEEIRKKIEKTRCEKYGEHKEQIHQKAKETFLKNYGVDNPQKNKDIRHKTEITNIKKYGNKTPYSYGSQEMKSLMIEKYGVEYPLQNKVIRKRAVKRYFYDEKYFDSSYELLFYKWLKDNSINFTYQPYDDTLWWNGHHYTPDFKVEEQFIEIKGEQFFKNGRLYNPFKKIFMTDYEEMLKHFNIKILRKNDLIKIIGKLDTKWANLYNLR